jgi:type IV secretory pathway VirJ component
MGSMRSSPTIFDRWSGQLLPLKRKQASPLPTPTTEGTIAVPILCREHQPESRRTKVLRPLETVVSIATVFAAVVIISGAIGPPKARDWAAHNKVAQAKTAMQDPEHLTAQVARPGANSGKMAKVFSPECEKAQDARTARQDAAYKRQVIKSKACGQDFVCKAAADAQWHGAAPNYDPAVNAACGFE